MWFEIFAGWVVFLLVGTAVLINVGRVFPALSFGLLVVGYVLGGITLGYWLGVSPLWPILTGLVLCGGALCLLLVIGGAAKGKATEQG